VGTETGTYSVKMREKKWKMDCKEWSRLRGEKMIKSELAQWGTSY